MLLNYRYSLNYQIYLAFVIIEQKHSLEKIRKLKNNITMLKNENSYTKILIYNNIYYTRNNYPFNFYLGTERVQYLKCY